MNHQATAITSADLALIQRMIPHRYPFLLVDKVRDIVANVGAVGIKNITCNEPQFQGHFPGNPIFPGVQIIEALAQTAAIVVSVSMGLIDRKTWSISWRLMVPNSGARWCPVMCWSCMWRSSGLAAGSGNSAGARWSMVSWPQNAT